jgi:hypothetical protein
MADVQYEPSVVTSRGGTEALEILSFQGAGGVPNRDAWAFNFLVRTAPAVEPFGVGVVFGGMTLKFGDPLAGLGVPSSATPELAFVYLAEARIGDYIDEEGFPEPPENGRFATYIECLSDRFEIWENRTPANDEDIEQHIRNRLFWGWRYDHEETVLRVPDFIRLRAPLASVHRIVELGNGSDWAVTGSEPHAIRLRPTQAFLQAERKLRTTATVVPVRRTPVFPAFVDEDRLSQLRAITSAQYDLTRLIALCNELNTCAANGCVLAIAMLTRALIDHVPPIFQAKTFVELASNYAGSRSFKDSMQHLSNSARRIADSHLHVQIRSREVLPNMVQVDFSRDLDVLLAEIVRVLGSTQSRIE